MNKDETIIGLASLVLEMGHIIRWHDEDCEWIEYWANDGNEFGPDYVGDTRFTELPLEIQKEAEEKALAQLAKYGS